MPGKLIPARCLKILLPALALTSILLPAAAIPARAQTETILYAFPNCNFACSPDAGVALDKKGNLYGITSPYGIFSLTPSGTFTHIGLPESAFAPFGGLILDSKGNVYSTTFYGGSSDYGTVFEMSPTKTGWTGTVLYNFTNGLDGGSPGAGVVRDSKGNLYSTTQYGGEFGAGTVFEVSPSGTEKVIYSFLENPEVGYYPEVGVVRDSKGNLYGTTLHGGTSNMGAVYKVTPAGTATILHSFTANGEDGFHPAAGVILDSKDNLYGTTTLGGAVGAGTVFKLSRTETETILHSFTGGADGIFPQAALILDKNGNLYGTTEYGGSFDLGTVFELTPTGMETVLHSFANDGTDGIYPLAGVAIDTAGNLYGTTVEGGGGNCEGGCGGVFKIVP